MAAALLGAPALAEAPEEDPEAPGQEDLDRLLRRIRLLEEQLDAVAGSPEDHTGGQLVDLEARMHGDAAISLLQVNEDPITFAMADLWLGWSVNLDQRQHLDLALQLEPEEGFWPTRLDMLHYEATPTPWLGISAGKLRSPLSYWNTHIPRGSFQTALSGPPDPLAEEHHGGPLPGHQIGAELRLTRDIDLWALNVAAGVGNGRLTSLDHHATEGRDDGAFKALSLRLWADGTEGLSAGAVGYFDVLEPEEPREDGGCGAPLIEDAGEISDTTLEGIGGGYLALTSQQLEFIGEGFLVAHQRGCDPVVLNRSAYAVFSYSVGLLRPYFAYSFVERSSEDPLYAELGSDQSGSSWIGGARLELGVHAALRAEVAWRDTVTYGREDGEWEAHGESGLTARLQLAAGF